MWLLDLPCLNRPAWKLIFCIIRYNCILLLEFGRIGTLLTLASLKRRLWEHNINVCRSPIGLHQSLGWCQWNHQSESVLQLPHSLDVQWCSGILSLHGESGAGTEGLDLWPDRLRLLKWVRMIFFITASKIPIHAKRNTIVCWLIGRSLWLSPVDQCIMDIIIGIANNSAISIIAKNICLQKMSGELDLWRPHDPNPNCWNLIQFYI